MINQETSQNYVYQNQAFDINKFSIVINTASTEESAQELEELQRRFNTVYDLIHYHIVVQAVSCQLLLMELEKHLALGYTIEHSPRSKVGFTYGGFLNKPQSLQESEKQLINTKVATIYKDAVAANLRAQKESELELEIARIKSGYERQHHEAEAAIEESIRQEAIKNLKVRGINNDSQY
ncbi:hypothetical protein [Azomonas macrocytogenes]|uniref:Uncharacterized protein n=1 Tax=Azomonas macrocytogenes TaxID=69962 RepID=A0A839T817_AZOMA|nr:hypothetical protein [Azomonas macrocytogenes]MBB3104394.1 hypothetical protein [Azomonas macrocytogenes]